ncbi:TPA: CoA transferase [Burkholderia multivorans]|uniref:CaiB/BaiF CoA transferase family protein n=1 Tax=Burkholderia multivorans TaxID=87883 RepID=UPI001C23D8B6|nr:CoA transferase [Burkholderia multivorans]MBU9349522.1 CoA transferase [Burkholderia multivorans]MBU9393084.1 CoA transferase [Burkholderia multivorans]HDR9838411.1 CoA transferase [Burkholderia multivorans]HDR9843043.1 CoA transferase [Burkholderia multivorans]HDR9850652.1 CoA transferase [Burkholderia multivorans]
MTEHERPGALAGLRIIDLSRVLGGPYATQVLADHGAEVIKVEPPSGDETRTWGPPFDGDTASYFLGVNRNKLGITLDLTKPDDRERLLGLLDEADALVENFRIGTMERWGLDFDALHARFPRLVYCRVSGFGADGPLGGLPGYDAAVQAMTGLMSVNGEAGGAPLRVGVPIVDLVTGLNAALGVLMALRERDASGRGQFVETTLFDCALSILHPHTPNFFHSGRAPVRTGNAHPNITPYDSFPTATVDIFLAVGNNGQFAALCDVLGTRDWLDDPRFADNRARSANRTALRALLETALAAHDGAALAERLMRSGVPCAPVLGLDAALAHPHVAHRAMKVELGAHRGIASPIKLGRTPATYRRAPPALNEHAAQLFGADDDRTD